MFCANCQKETEHTASIADNGEIIMECPCGRFLKFPADSTKESIEAYQVAHEAANKGQKSVESIHAEQAKRLNEIFPDAPDQETHVPVTQE